MWSLASAVVLSLLSTTSRASSDTQVSWESSYEFTHKIERVAVIGAGASGLQHAATLLEQGFKVRLFERAPGPGGQWFYSDKTPLPASFPNRPIEVAAYVPDIPSKLPMTRYYQDGEDGISNEWRIREHWNPSSNWAGMKTTIPPSFMSLPNLQYPPDTPWSESHRVIQRHVRQYASSVGLNANDEENVNVTSYSTRVERMVKLPGSKSWTLTLRRMHDLLHDNGRLRVDWWTEEFDAVVVATRSEADSASVPPIPGLDEWAKAHPERIYHGRDYRRPDRLVGKNVLIVGGALSGVGIAKDLAPYASLTSSIRDHPNQSPLSRAIQNMIPDNVTIVPEIVAFSDYHTQAGTSVRDATLLLANGTSIKGFDHIILATGYRFSFPFLVGFHNSSIIGKDEPETEVAPIITDGTQTRSLHWTGHYIPDPTLALTTVSPWELAQYQATGFARVWLGKARLPSKEVMWKTYPGPGGDRTPPGYSEPYHRLFVTWLNDAALEFGGRLVKTKPRDVEALDYFAFKRYGSFLGLHKLQEQLENRPRSQWPVRNETEDTPSFAGSGQPRHWAELSDNW